MDNRKRILDVSLDLFYGKGYDAVSVQEIVEGAGITKPTLYYYYGSKYGLLEALLEYGFSVFMEMLEPSFRMAAETSSEQNFDVPDVLFEVAKAFLTSASQNSKFFFFMLSLMYSAKENEPYLAVKPHLYRLYNEITDLFEGFGNRLGNMNGRQEVFAMGFLGFLNQYAFTNLEKNFNQQSELETHFSDEEIRGLIHQFMYGIVN